MTLTWFTSYQVMAITRDGNGKHLHVGFQFNLWPIFLLHSSHLEIVKLCSVLLLSVGLRLSVCLLADFIVVVNLLLDDYGSADFSNLCVCYVVNVQGITRHLRLKLVVLINLKRVK